MLLHAFALSIPPTLLKINHGLDDVCSALDMYDMITDYVFVNQSP
jgi:hypothetical protein